MSQGNGSEGPTQTVPSHAEVERAIRSVPGVAEASIARSADTGRGRLRIRLHPGEDAERVSWSVAATLRERFGIALDPEQIRPRVAEGDVDLEPEDRQAPVGDSGVDDLRIDAPGAGPATTAPSAHEQADTAHLPDTGEVATEDAAVLVGDAPVTAADPDEGSATGLAAAPERAAWRPAIRDLSSRNDGTAVSVTARLELDGHTVAGEAAGAPTARGLRRAIAEATVRAVGELTCSPLRAQVDRVSIGGSDPAAVSVVVSLLSGRGEELLLGAAIVRDDVEHAVMRATLDALNRRVERELVG